MDQHIEQLMRMASLEIEAYDMQTRREMSSLNRRMPCYVMSYLQLGTAILEIYDEVYDRAVLLLFLRTCYIAIIKRIVSPPHFCGGIFLLKFNIQ